MVEVWRDIKKGWLPEAAFSISVVGNAHFELKVGFAAPVEIGQRHILSIDVFWEDLLVKEIADGAVSEGWK